MTDGPSPWLERFVPLSREEIARRCERAPQRIEIGDCDVETGCLRLTGALERVFTATDQVVAIVERLYLRAKAHVASAYTDQRSFSERAFSVQMPPRFIPPIYLTGLAGTGKTELVSALQRIMPEDGYVDLDGGCRRLPTSSMWRVALSGVATARAVFRELLGRYRADLPAHSDALAEVCRHYAYTRGVSLLVVDEW